MQIVTKPAGNNCDRITTNIIFNTPRQSCTIAGIATLLAAIFKFVNDQKQPIKKCGTTVIAESKNN